ncbi:MAG: ATP-dependent DNA ligase, partial [Chitinophagaceae bacterium]
MQQSEDNEIFLNPPLGDEGITPSGDGGLRLFAELVTKLGTSTKTNDKLDALVNYFSVAEGKDKVWVIAIFSGRRPKRAVNSTQLATYCIELTELPFWLFEESYHTVGDLAETISLLLPENETPEEIKNARPLHYYIEKLKTIEKESEEIRKAFILDSWKTMTSPERFVFNKLITGGFRIGVSQKLMVNALAKTINIEPSVIAHGISGNWDPSTITFEEILSEHSLATDWSKPYPFYLAYALEEEVEVLGDPKAWQAEWKWDGIRGQIIKRNSELFVWSRGEELMTEKFPEYHSLQNILPDGIAIDGEIIPSADQKPLPFALLQTRIGRKNITKKQLSEAPIAFFAYDLLEYNGEDWRNKPLEERRNKLEELIAEYNHPALLISPVIPYNSW